MPSGLNLGAVCPGDVEGDVGGERRLAHARAAGQHDEVGRLQAAHLGVEVAQAGGDAGELAVALERLGGHVDGNGQRLGKALEAAIVAAGLGQFVQLSLGVLDLGPRREIHRRLVGDVDHVLADPDQVAAQCHVVNGAAVILGVDDGGGLSREAGEVLADRHATDIGIGRQERLQGDRSGDLAHPDQAARGLVDRLMERLEVVFRFQKVRHPVERVVVDEYGAKQRLFRLDIVRCAPIGRSSGVGSEF